MPAQPMSKDTAGEMYLAAVCPSNAAMGKWAAATDTYDMETGAGFAEVIAASAEARDASQAAAQALESDRWPENVREDIDGVRSDMFIDVADFANFASAKTPEELNTMVSTPYEHEGSAQAVRGGLGLSADADASCGVVE